MKKVFKELEKYLHSTDSILNHITEVEALRLALNKESDLILFVNAVRDRVQREAAQAVIDNDGRGLVAMATGSGKSRVAIMLCQHYSPLNDKKISLLVPTQKLRDEIWKEEFEKWDAGHYWRNVNSQCYASASKINDYDYLLGILDEGHNITELSSTFFDNNNVKNIVVLTATPPEDREKEELLENLGVPVVYTLTLEDAIRLGFVAPYQISVIRVPLNCVDKNVVAGSKERPFMTTERANYNYLSESIDYLKQFRDYKSITKRKFLILKRMQTIYKLETKTQAAKWLLANVILPDERLLSFCGTKEQANQMGEHVFHSSSGNASYNLFKSQEINQLHCVKSINEGHNLLMLDKGLVVQLNSKKKDLIQRIGRLIRFRAGHEAMIYILVAQETQDEVWLEEALKGTSPDRVKYYSLEEFKTLHHEHQKIRQD